MADPVPSAGGGKSTLVIVIAAIVGVGGLLSCLVCGGLLVLGVPKARESAKRIECTNNLMQLGIAMHNLHDTNASFPTEAEPNPSIYVQLLPFMELQNIAAAIQRGDTAAPNTPVKLFLCPSRRSPTVGGKRDYGYAASQQGSASVLDAPTQPPLTLNIITNANGASNTLVLAHVWIDPRNYQGGDSTDQGWATKNNARSANNVAFQDNNPAGSTANLGGPHSGGSPCLFADGHVQMVPYQFANWAQAWNWQNTTPFQLR